MRKFLMISFMLSMPFAASADSAVNASEIGMPIEVDDQDFKKINKSVEYFDAKTRMVQAQTKLYEAATEAAEAQQGISPTATVQQQASPGSVAGNIPRALRGRTAGDGVYFDAKGNLVQEQKKPQAFVSSISGMSSSLVAELVWGDRTIPVRRGDTMIGGGWIVEAVNADDIVIVKGDKSLRIGVVPVNIEDIIN